ncbi:MAG: DUF1295 domain-containing protein [Zhongshania sp.]|uniref:DUF1295 domain-containing protein n=1 Tax=Zhongshania sp. TaxID=1971902 RepID=UPI002633FFCC|nr:DUF1295 domain-containing protein [Zhongshania sp.]MDF1691896.1 DUF1295 domain-containing protein [Zhongshania sp.]
MKKSAQTALLAVFMMLAVAALIALLAGQGLPRYAGLSLVLWSLLIAVAVQWLVFVHAYYYQTEQFYDLTGAATNIGIVVFGFSLSAATPRDYLLLACIVIWALRLGAFLFWRVRVDGGDTRFASIKPDFYRFLLTWTLQGMWIFLILLCTLLAMATENPKPLGLMTLFGFACWLLGMVVESIADVQKRLFRAEPSNAGQFIHHGLWAWSRHPNYFGEILLWLGIAIIALPVLSGWMYLGLLSPLFVILLLSKVSGIPLLEASADQRWGNNVRYQHYKAQTPVLIPRRPKLREKTD